MSTKIATRRRCRLHFQAVSTLRLSRSPDGKTSNHKGFGTSYVSLVKLVRQLKNTFVPLCFHVFLPWVSDIVLKQASILYLHNSVGRD